MKVQNFHLLKEDGFLLNQTYSSNLKLFGASDISYRILEAKL